MGMISPGHKFRRPSMGADDLLADDLGCGPSRNALVEDPHRDKNKKKEIGNEFSLMRGDNDWKVEHALVVT